MASKKPVINRDNPAFNFISQAGEEPSKPEELKEAEQIQSGRNTEKAPAGYKRNPLYVEVKSRRLQLVLQPSLFEAVKAKAKEKGLSVNEFCHEVLDKATREEM